MHSPYTRSTLVFFLVASAILLGPSLERAAAQPSAADTHAPSQALDSDPSSPVPRIALTVDPLALYFGSYGLSVEFAPRRYQSVWISPAWARSGVREGLALELGWHLWPQGRGLDGIFLGPIAGVGTSRGAGRQLSVRGGAELGYQAVWGALSMGLAVGVDYDWRRQDEEVRSGATLRVRLAFGWAYL